MHILLVYQQIKNKNKYKLYSAHWYCEFVLQITKLFNDDNNKIKETYIQAYYTNELKLRIRFSKEILAKLLFTDRGTWGNDKNIKIDVSNPNVLGIRNKNNNPVKITMKSR
ncbi:MAG: hypothetical protein SPLM_09460 [Spiroplasma phoeniceum]|uniref:hypothetical protein n=1 Tax=Spiroplasma phoeniceum TaxID=47835 RepID=UPI0031342171